MVRESETAEFSSRFLQIMSVSSVGRVLRFGGKLEDEVAADVSSEFWLLT